MNETDGCSGPGLTGHDADRRNAATLPLLFLAGIITGCASVPRPDAELARADASLAQAEQAGARQLSGAEYDAARDKLTNARRLADGGDNAEARVLAQQAEMDAELAAARARHSAADKAADEVEAATRTLQQELTRQSQPGTPAP